MSNGAHETRASRFVFAVVMVIAACQPTLTSGPVFRLTNNSPFYHNHSGRLSIEKVASTIFITEIFTLFYNQFKSNFGVKCRLKVR